MSDTADEEDSRETCKYGSLCYQKNPKHHEKFKHPYKIAKVRGSLENDDLPKNKKGKYENNAEIKDSTSSLNNVKAPETEIYKDVIRDKFLINMPIDFFDFWNFCKDLNASNPLNALQDIDLVLVGPYDVLFGKFENVNLTNEDYLKHWRYFYDPPELVTVLANEKTGYHIGYFRDEPYSNEHIVASNNGKDCILTSLGDNIYTAIKSYIEEKLKKCNPFSKPKIQKFQKTFLSKYESEANSQNNTKKRQKKIVCKTLHKLGLVVPFDRKTEVGYRELIENDATLHKKLKVFLESDSQKVIDSAMASIQPIITAVNLATDECDFGTAIEFGLDLFCIGSKHLHNLALSFLRTGYDLVNRKEFITIIEAHLKDRRIGNNMSIL